MQNKLIIVGNIEQDGRNHGNDNVFDPNGICPTLLARDWKDAKRIIIPNTTGVYGQRNRETSK